MIWLLGVEPFSLLPVRLGPAWLMPPSGVLRAHAGACGRVHFALALLAFGLPLSLGLLSCVGHIFTLCPDRYLLCPCSPVSFLSLLASFSCPCTLAPAVQAKTQDPIIGHKSFTHHTPNRSTSTCLFPSGPIRRMGVVLILGGMPFYLVQLV